MGLLTVVGYRRHLKRCCQGLNRPTVHDVLGIQSVCDFRVAEDALQHARQHSCPYLAYKAHNLLTLAPYASAHAQSCSALTAIAAARCSAVTSMSSAACITQASTTVMRAYSSLVTASAAATFGSNQLGVCNTVLPRQHDQHEQANTPASSPSILALRLQQAVRVLCRVSCALHLIVKWQVLHGSALCH